MATRLPNLRTLEGIEQMKHRLLLAENKLKEKERKADARRKIILGGAVIAMTKNNPTLALTVLKALDAFVPIARDRKDLEAYLPGGAVFESLASGQKIQGGPVVKTRAPEAPVGGKPPADRVEKIGAETAPVEAKTFATPAEKTAPIGPASEQKLSAPPVAKPVADRPVSEPKLSSGLAGKPIGNPAVGGGNPGTPAPQNPAGTVGQSTSSLPFSRPQNGADGERPAERPIPSGILKIGGRPFGQQPGEGGA